MYEKRNGPVAREAGKWGSVVVVVVVVRKEVECCSWVVAVLELVTGDHWNKGKNKGYQCDSNKETSTRNDMEFLR